MAKPQQTRPGMLWLMRHASAGPTTDAKDDDERPLDSQGRKEAHAAGITLQKIKTPLDHCFSSPLERTMETAGIVCDILGIPLEPEPKLAGMPLSVADVKMMIDGHGNCLLVGHAPGLNLVVYKFTGAQVQITKSGLAQIHEGELWSMLNASTCFAMAGQEDEFDDPQDVDSRALDDAWRGRRSTRPVSAGHL
jgi:phosphohistidine phosphatase